MNNVIKTLKSIPTRLPKALAIIISIIVIIPILIQCAFIGGVIWMNSQSGHNFLKSQITAATKDTDYNINFSKISYAFPQGIKIKEIKVTSNTKTIFDIDKIIIRPNLAGIGIRHLGIGININKLTIHKIPKSKEKEESTKKTAPIQPFSVPQIYFKYFALDNLEIKNLDIKESAFGLALNLSPTLKSEVKIDENINIESELRVKNLKDITVPWIPKLILLKGKINPKSLDVEIKSLIANNENIQTSAQGNIKLNETNRIDIKSVIEIKDFEPFAEGLKGSSKIITHVNGSLNAPTIRSTGMVAIPLLTEKGLSDVLFEISAKNLNTSPLGNISIETSHQNKVVKLSTDINFKNDILTLKSIKGIAPHAILNGNLDLNTKTQLADGKINAEITDLFYYSALANMDIKGRAKAGMTLTTNHTDMRQSATINTTINKAAYETLTIESANLSAHIKDIKNPQPSKIQLNVNNFSPANNVIINAVNTTITKKNNDTYALAYSSAVMQT